MKLYRNYDGNKSGFGDTSVLASVPAPDNLSAFAATRTGDGALTVMVINKYLTGNTPVTINTANFSGNGIALVYQLTSTNAITRLSDVAYSGTSLSTTVPQQSITLFVLASGTPNTPPTAVISAPVGPVTGNAPFAVNFNGTGSNDSDGSITSYAWTFGDGTQATGITASHTYTTAGSYTAKLTVTDNRGATGFATVLITVNPDPTILNAPSNLAASAASSVVTLTWKDNSSNENGFYIERAPSGSTSFVQVGSVGANVVKYTESRTRGTYLYRVRAFNATNTSAYSNQVQIRVK
jgi:PKD repeat protein